MLLKFSKGRCREEFRKLGVGFSKYLSMRFDLAVAQIRDLNQKNLDLSIFEISIQGLTAHDNRRHTHLDH